MRWVRAVRGMTGEEKRREDNKERDREEGEGEEEGYQFSFDCAAR